MKYIVVLLESSDDSSNAVFFARYGIKVKRASTPDVHYIILSLSEKIMSQIFC